MWFVDHAKISVGAGNGGRGCAAFAQPPYTRYPYPDGGNGGDGGDVIVMADHNIATLLDFHFRHEFAGTRGEHGGSNNKTGKRGEDSVIRVPVGTVILDAKTGDILRDLKRADERVVVAHGGRGGVGNKNASEAQPGEPGEQREITLELKLIADVGLVGFPNAGKSSLLARISTARPKVAPYPFTTRYPVLGVVSVDGRPSPGTRRRRVGAGSAADREVSGRGAFVACDIPGLIEGAHEGKGMGMQFLRHIERTRLLVHLIDMAGVDGRDPCEAYRLLNEELTAYSPTLGHRAQVLVANKMDLPQAQENLERFRATVAEPVLPISCATGTGVPKLLSVVWERLQTVSHTS